MSQVLDAVRAKWPAYKDTPDDVLATAIGNKWPAYLDQPDFKAEYDQARGIGVVPGAGVIGETGARPGPEMIPPTQPAPAVPMSSLRAPRFGQKKTFLGQAAAGTANLAMDVTGALAENPEYLLMGAGKLAQAALTLPVLVQMGKLAPEEGAAALLAAKQGDIQGTIQHGGAALLTALGIRQMVKPSVAPETAKALEEMPSGPPRAGSELPMPKGARPPMEAAPELYLNPPEQAAAQAKAMTREATAAYEPPKPPKPEVPSTPPEPYETVLEAIRNAKADTTGKVQQLFPAAQLNRQQAAELRRLAFGQAKTTPPPAEPLLDRLQAALDKGDFNQIKKIGQKLAVFDEVPESVFKEPESPKPAETKPEAPAEAPKVEDLLPKPPEEPPAAPPAEPVPKPPTAPPASPLAMNFAQFLHAPREGALADAIGQVANRDALSPRELYDTLVERGAIQYPKATTADILPPKTETPPAIPETKDPASIVLQQSNSGEAAKAIEQSGGVILSRSQAAVTAVMDTPNGLWGGTITTTPDGKGASLATGHRIIENPTEYLQWFVDNKGVKLPSELSQKYGVKPPAVAETKAPEETRLSPADKAITQSEKEFRATAEGQKAMAARASRIAVLHQLNEAIRKVDPKEAYDRGLLDTLPDSQIDSMIESLRQDYNKIVPPKTEPPPAVPETKAPERETSAAKEPWEMTRGEVAHRANIAAKLSPALPTQAPKDYWVLKAITDKANRKPHNPDLLVGQSILDLKNQGMISGVKNLKLTDKGRNQFENWSRQQREYDLAYGDLADKAIDSALDAHKAAIEQALREGKSVPADVLSDYPDLKVEARPQFIPKSLGNTGKEIYQGMHQATGRPPTGDISIGPGARSPGEPMKPEIEQLTDAFKGIEGKKVPIGDKVKEAFDVGGKISALRDAFGGALHGLKATGDFLMRQWKGATLDDLLRNKGELSAAMEQRGWETRKWAAQVKKQMPSLAERKAVSSYVDAGGDMALLEAAAREVPEARRQAYRDAMNLSPDAKVAAENLVSYAEGRFQQAFDAGVLENALDDYIHRIYQKAPDLERRASAYVQSGILQANPGLARHRMFQFDFEAEKAGLAVEKDFIPRIADYEISLSKAIAAREFIRKAVDLKTPDGSPMLIQAGVGVPIEDAAGVREATLIKPSGGGNLRENYVERDYPALKKWKWAASDAEGKPILVQGNLMIHKSAVDRFDALLKPSWIRSSPKATAKALRGALAVSSTVKQSMMDLSEFHPVQVTVHAMEHRVMPWNILKDIDFTNPDVEGLLRGGVTLGGEGYFGNYSEGLMGRSLVRTIPGLDKILAAHQDWIFQSFIPRLKMTMALDALERNRARYPRMSPDELNYLTAREANAAFGEQNYIMLERSKTFQDVARLLLLAPDFLESRARFVAQAFTRYGGEQRVALLLGAATMWTAARLMNKAVDDQFHFEPDNLFSVVYNGKSYGLRTLQGDVLHLLERPLQFWMNRLNPVFTRTAIEALTGRDAFGRKRTLGQQAWDAVGTAVPISLRSSRERGLHESLLQAFGVNARRFSDVDTAYQMAQKWKQANGVQERGEFIYDPEKDALRSLKIALSQGDEAGAVGEIKKVIESKAYTRSKLNDYFNRYANMPFTGSAANDRKFFKTLSVDERKTVEAAKTHKRNIRDLYRKARDQYDAAKASKK